MNMNNDNSQIILDSTDKKKNSRRAGKIAAAVSAAAVAVGAVSAAAVPTVRNTAKMAFSSPENYYADILRSAALKKSETLARSYMRYCEKASEGITDKGSFTLTLGDEFAREADIPAGTSFGIDYSASAKGGKSSGVIALSANGNALADISAIADADNDMMYLSFPFLTSEWLSASGEDLADSFKDMFYGSDAESFKGDIDNSLIDGSVFTEERLSRIFSKYTDIYLGYAKDVTLEKNKEFTSASGISAKYTSAHVKLTEEDIYSLSADILTAAKDDEDIQTIWKALGGSQEAYDDFISENLSDISDQQTNIGSGSIDIELYIASNGKIMGASAVSDNEGYKASVSTISYIKGSSIAFDWNSENSSSYESYGSASTSSDKLSFTFDGTVSGGKINGNGKLTSTSSYSYSYPDSDLSDYSSDSSVSFDVTVTDLDKSALSKDDVIGQFSIKGGNEEASVDIVLTADKDSVSCTADIFAEESKFLSLSATDKQYPYEEVIVPDGKTYKLTDTDSVMEFCKTLDLGKFRENVRSARSVLGDEMTDGLLELADELEMELNSAQSGENINWYGSQNSGGLGDDWQ